MQKGDVSGDFARCVAQSRQRNVDTSSRVQCSRPAVQTMTSSGMQCSGLAGQGCSLFKDVWFDLPGKVPVCVKVALLQICSSSCGLLQVCIDGPAGLVHSDILCTPRDMPCKERNEARLLHGGDCSIGSRC